MNSILPSASLLVCGIRFLFFIFGAVLPCGMLLLKLFQLRLRSRLEILSISLLTGTIFITTLYFFFRWTHSEQFFIPSLIVILILWILSLIRDIPAVRTALFSSAPRETVFFVIFLFSIALYNFSHSVGAVQWTPDGGLILTKGSFSDALWKISVISELEHSVPPQMPIYAGHRLHYHYFAELLVILANALTRIDILNLYLLWVPLLTFLILGLLAFAALRRILGNARLGLLGSIFMLTPLASGTLRYAPHIALAISLFFAIILLVSEAMRTGAKRRWALPIFLMGHIMMFESILSLCYVPALGLGTLLLGLWRKKFAPLLAVVLGVVLAVSLQIFANGKLGGKGGEVFTLSFPVFQEALLDSPVTKHTLRSIVDFYKTHPYTSWDRTILAQIISLPFLFTLSLARTLFTLLKLGLLAIPLLFKKIRSLRSEDPETVFFILTLAVGFVFPLFIGVSYWRGISLRIFSTTGVLLHALAAVVIADLWQRSRSKKALAVTLVFFLLCFPILLRAHSSRLYADDHVYLSPHQMELFNYLRTETPKDAILMHPFIDDPILNFKKGGKVAWVYKDHYLYGSALGGRRVVQEGPITGVIKAMAKLEDLEKIRSDIQTIYTTQNPEEALDILKKYRVSYLWVPKDRPLRFAPAFLKPAKENDEHVLYQVLIDT